MFELEKLVVLGGQGKRDEAFQLFGYVSNDDITTLLVEGYFNDLTGKASINDMILIQDSDDELISYLKINSIDLTGTVTVINMGINIGELPYLDLQTDPDPVPTYKEGRLTWNGKEYTLNIDTGLDAVTVQVGQEILLLYYNNTGSDIPNGSILRPAGITTVDDLVVGIPALAQADVFSNAAGTLSMATMTIPDGELGFATRFGKVRGINTLGLSMGVDTYLSPTVAGSIVQTIPSFPDYNITLGAVLKVGETDGEFFFVQSTVVQDTINNAWDGSIRETFDFRVSSDGTDVTGTISNPNASNPDLTLIYSTGLYNFDVATKGTIALTPGTDTNPQANYVYILESTKSLTVSTSDWPDDVQHSKVAYILLRSATATQSNDALANQNWNDHIKKDDDNGHILHMAERLRQDSAKWDSGVLGSCTVTGTPSEVYIANTSGTAYQLHKQTFPVLDTSVDDDVHIVNDSTAPYKTLQDIAIQTLDANGDTLANRSFSFVLWGVQNKTGETSHIMINLPTGSYLKNAPDSAVNDASNYSVYDIPAPFKSVGFLIARFTYVLESNGTTWSLYSTQDLRGFQPSNAAGGSSGGGGVSEFTALDDTPSAYTSQAGKVPAVNAGETALEFITLPYEDGYIKSLIPSNNTDTDHDITISTGKARDSSDTVNINLTSAITKQIDVDWAEGTDDGGFPSGLTLAADTTYHLFIISKTDGTVDAGFDTSLTATNLLADATTYTYYRRVGKIFTDASSNILNYQTTGDESNIIYKYNTPIIDRPYSSAGSTNRTALNLSVPSNSNALVNIMQRGGSTTQHAWYFTEEGQDDLAPSYSGINTIQGNINTITQLETKYKVNDSSQIYFRCSSSVLTGTKVITISYEDIR